MNEIKDWATANGILEFLPKILEAGFDTLSVIAEIDKSDLDYMEITLPGHRKKILLAVTKLKESLNQSSQTQPTPPEPSAASPSTEQNENNKVEEENVKEAVESRAAIMQLIDNHSSSLRSTSNKVFEAVCKADVAELLELLQTQSNLPFLNQLCHSQTPLHVAVSNFGSLISFSDHQSLLLLF